jgi:hypothetical protein
MTTAGLAAFVADVVGGVVYASAGPAALFGICAACSAAAAASGWRTFPHR